MGAKSLRPLRPESPPGGDPCLLVRGGKDVGPPWPRAARCPGAVPGHRTVVEVVADVPGLWHIYHTGGVRPGRRACGPAPGRGAPRLLVPRRINVMGERRGVSPPVP